MRHVMRKRQGLSGIKGIATVAVWLAGTGGGVALAQGAPPGLGAWHSGWPSFIEAQKSPPAGDAREVATSRSDSRAAIRAGDPARAASDVRGGHRGS